jgi:hypothetical protein
MNGATDVTNDRGLVQDEKCGCKPSVSRNVAKVPTFVTSD